MSAISLSSQEDLKAWTIYAFLFWPAVTTLWFLGRSGKNTLDTVIRIATGIICGIALVVTAIIFKTIISLLFDIMSTENLLYVDIFIYVLWLLLNSVELFRKCWTFFDVVFGLYVIVRLNDYFDLLIPLELTKVQKFEWILGFFFVIAPIMFAATLINFFVLQHLRENNDKTANAFPSQSLDGKAQKTITIDTFINSILPLDNLFNSVGTTQECYV